MSASLSSTGPQQASLLPDDELAVAGALAAAAASAMPLSPLWQRFFAATGLAGWQDMPARALRLQRRVQEDGATYNVHEAGAEASARAWPLELLPMLVDADEWQGIERGVVQRARLLNLTLADVYGERRLLDAGLLPPSLVLAHPQYLRPMHGCVPPGGVHLHVLAFDLARGADGRWSVLGQRTQAPAGLGYMLGNRLIVAQQFPEAFQALSVQRLGASYQALLQGLMRLSPAGERARVALLTPGPQQEKSYFEHAVLASHLGISLVEGGDLTVRDNRVFLKTLHGLEPVHVLLRRVADDDLDPLELRADSALGVPGLLQALRAGGVVLANAPGAGWLESPGLAAFWPGVARHLLGEELLLPAGTAWWCGEEAVWRAHADRLDDYLVVPTFPSSASTRGFAPVAVAGLDAQARAALLARIAADPAAHTLQALPPPPAETPVWRAGRLEPRAALLRVFALSDGAGGWQLMPGGLTRVAGPGVAGSHPLSALRDAGASADTWVRTEDEVNPTSLLRKPLSAADLSGAYWTVTSRSAENLFWLGRYTERAENSVRLAQLSLEALAEAADAGPVLPLLDELARHHGLVGVGAPVAGQAPRQFERALLQALADTRDATSVAWNLQALQSCSRTLRERLSSEHWQLIHEVGDHFGQHMRALLDGADARVDALGLLARAATDLAAITGAQTDRMTRDDGWRLLSVGRQVERLDFLAHALAAGCAHGLPHSDAGFALLLGLFDSTMTYRAKFQARRELAPLLHLLVFDSDNPRSLAWVARTLRGRLLKLARHEPDWAAAVSAPLPLPEAWSLERLCTPAAASDPAELLALLRDCSAQAQALSVALGRKLFAHVSSTDQRVWQ